MLRYLLQRPIAVTVTLTAALSLSLLAWFALPVSLLPPLQVPYLTIAVKSPGRAPIDIEQNLLAPVREGMLTLNNLKDLESTARNETGTITLRFKYGANMDLAYIEVNEKIDRLTSTLPPGMERPLVMKSSTSDIPVLHIQVIPKMEEDLVAISELTTHVLKRRLEQIDGVGLVDLNGVQKKIIAIEIDEARLASLNLSPSNIAEAIQSANMEMGSISVRDGNYRYFLKIAPTLKTLNDLKQLPVLFPTGSYLPLDRLASVKLTTAKSQGLHLFQNKQALVLAVHKQPSARLPDLMPKLEEAINRFRADYPQMDFQKTQDQSLLLTLSIQNMSSSLLWGGLFAFVILFFFMGNWREPVIMGIVLPVSLLLSFSLLYLFDISLNIISLSGLALGMGMLVDNSVVVIDNIMMKRKEGHNLLESCVRGTGEVMAPLLSSALTNMAVFVPLIFMGGISGELFYDQALSVAAILLASILCTFVIVPLTYLMLFQQLKKETREDSKFFTAVKKGYHRSFLFIWNHQKISMALMCLLIPLPFLMIWLLPKEAIPEIERWETLVTVDWREPIDLDENRKRTEEMVVASGAAISEVDVGFRQFTFGTEQYSVQQADIYLLFLNASIRKNAHKKLEQWFSTKYPQASVELKNAPNAFEQVFSVNSPLLEVRFRDFKTRKLLPIPRADSLLAQTTSQSLGKPGKGFEKETIISLKPDFLKLSDFHIKYEKVVSELSRLFDDFPVTQLKSFSDNTPVVFRQGNQDFLEKLKHSFVTADNDSRYPLLNFIEVNYKEDYRNITADQAGIYQDIEMKNPEDAFQKSDVIGLIANQFETAADWTGQWYENQQNFKQLLIIMIISLILMYFILSAEFESLKQPLLVLSSFPIGLAGSFLLLWISGETINVMTGIGLVVVLGILDNDAILKIDRINTLRKIMPLEQAIEQAGLDRLKPIVMNTLTNVLAITPIVFSSGLGADLQRPVAIATIGGLLVATMAALYFIPLMYWMTTSVKKTVAINH